MQSYPGELFASLGQARIDTIKDDAKMIAMPVAEFDREVQRQHEQRLAAEGWGLLTLASFLVPVVGVALLAASAWELLGEAYHGIDAWREGEMHEALDHLMNVATELAVLGAVVAGGSVIQRVWRRSSLVDNLVPARLEDGSTKLWLEDLVPFRCDPPPSSAVCDRAGVYRLGDQAWIEMNGVYYPVARRRADGRWHLQQRGGLGPALEHNGAGAWRLGSEQPAQWADAHDLFRRLGGAFRQLDDEQIDWVLMLHGLGADDLRALHVSGQAPQAGLEDTVERLRLDVRIRDMVSRLRSGQQVDDASVRLQAELLPGAAGLSDQDLAELAWRQRRRLLQRLYANRQADESPGVAVLRRVFPGLHQRAAQALVGAASVVDRQRLLGSGRVPLALAEAARACVLRIRAVRVYEAFYLDTPQNADLARVAMGLLKYLPGSAEGVRWRLFEGYGDGPLLVSVEEGEVTFDLVHMNGRFLLLDDRGQAQGEAGELFEAMSAAYDDRRRDAMHIGEPFAHNLRVLLGRIAVRRREGVEQILHDSRLRGWLQAPQRQADGQVGYPLSGRGAGRFPLQCMLASLRPRSLVNLVRALYPEFTDEHVHRWLGNVHLAGRNPHRELARLGNELEDLEHCLTLWGEEPVNASEQNSRDIISHALTCCWRRMGLAEAYPDALSNHFRLTIHSARPGTLPELSESVSFAHVTELLVFDMQLREVPPSFLRAFPRLQVLDLGGNRLTRVPPQLRQLEHLHELILVHNRIVLDGPQAVTLSRCVNLVHLNLSHNPLGRTFSLARLDQLTRLDMRNTGLAQLPDALLDRPNLVHADLRDNHIAQFPPELNLAPMRVRRRVRLAGNPCMDHAPLSPPGSLLSRSEDEVEAELQRQVQPRQRWSDALGPGDRGTLSRYWQLLGDRPGSARLFRVLRQLLQSEGFRHNPRAMAYRVLGLLREMIDSEELCQQLFTVANDEWGCQDGASWCFDNLEVKVLVWRALANAEGQAEQALLYLGRQLWRLEEVDRIATADLVSRGLVYEGSEVGLAYRIGLRGPLDLPIHTDDMSFPAIAGVDGPALDRARERVNAREVAQVIANSLVDRDFWQAHLELTRGERFLAVDAPFQERLAAVLDDASINQGEQLRQAEVIRVEQREARHALMLALTLDALETAPADAS